MPRKKSSPLEKIKNILNEKPKDPQVEHIKVERELVKEIKSLARQVERLKDYEILKIYKKPVKFLWFSFLKGLMIGFGSVIGASLLVGIFVFIMSRIQLVPVIGEFIQDVLEEIDVGNVISQPTEENP